MNHRNSTLPHLNVPSLLRKYGLRPQKKLGQNFLVDEAALQKVVDAAEITPDDLVLEVGPGLGSLTRFLSSQARAVIAVEIDRNLIPPLREVLAPWKNITVVQGDILELEINQLLTHTSRTPLFPQTSFDPSSYVVVANIPYYITSALIRHLLEGSRKPARIILTVQREVAMRICAAPPDLSLLALSVQVYGEPRITARIPAGAFYPVPSVDSAIIRIDLFPNPRIPDTDTFFRLVKAGFSQKRKNLRNTLSAGLGIAKPEVETLLNEAGIDPTRRAQTLSLGEWDALSQKMHLKP